MGHRLKRAGFKIDRRRPVNRRIAKNLSRWGLLLVLILASSYRQRYPAQTRIVDRGIFALLQAGHLIGQETFTLRASLGGGYRLTSMAELDVGAGQLLQLDQDFHLDRQWRPRQGQWRLRSGGVLGQASVEVHGHRARLEVHLGSQQGEREVRSDLDFVVVPSNVLSHLVIVHQILTRAEATPPASVLQFTGLDPWSLTAPIFEVRRVEPLQVEINAAGGVERADRFLAVLGPWNVELFVQGEHLIGWRLPYQRAFVYRSDLFPSGFSIHKGPRPDLQVPPGSEEREQRFPGHEGVSLAGTVMLPAKTGSDPLPAVLLIAGSGPIDRDGNAPGVSFDLQKALAYHLARNGVASFRYDKRGTGASDGDWRRASFRDLIEDARAALQWLREQPEVGPIFLLGHSEGAEIAPILAVEEPVAGLIAIAGPARPLDQLLLWQTEWLHRAQGFTESETQAAVEREAQLLDFIRRSQGEWDDYTLEDIQAELPWLTAGDFQALKNSFALSWYRQHFQHDPLETMRQVRVPV
ncbi:MAG: alpha/beta fold hydrolase, partial [Acidobacteria bacterium]